MIGLLRRAGWLIIAVCLTLSGLLAVPSAAPALGLKEQIVGTWRLASIYNEENGVKQYNLGENPLGMIMFDRSGNVIQLLVKPDLPKFAAGNRLKGTDEENRAVVRGVISGFGTYTVADEKGTVTIKWVASSFPNRTGTTETRTYKIVGDEMTGVNPTASSGGVSYTKYLRAK
jgi:Lipocalin-like domain